MGDPETEVVIPRLQTDLVALFAAMDNGTLIDVNIYTDEKRYAELVKSSRQHYENEINWDKWAQELKRKLNGYLATHQRINFKQ